MRLSFISNIRPDIRSGGVSGKNFATYTLLKKYFEVSEYIYINPKMDFFAKLKSKILRLTLGKGNYHFFSSSRLSKINRFFNASTKTGEVYFFLGFTQWIAIQPNQPYYCYNDASFATYVKIYNNKGEFLSKDLQRIFEDEKTWLSKAKTVFFTSRWALEETKKLYKLNGNNFINVGIGGFIDIPNEDKYEKDFNFLFMSREFLPKGGLVVAEALQIVRRSYPDAKLWIVGDAPPEDIRKQAGVQYLGFFSKSNLEQKQKLINIFSTAFCLVHPTLKDTTTLVITESAYFGCPAIASNRFAIPEFVEHGTTGLLINDPRDVQEVAKHMCYLIEHPLIYKSMRANVRTKALNHFTWEAVGEKFKQHISA